MGNETRLKSVGFVRRAMQKSGIYIEITRSVESYEVMVMTHETLAEEVSGLLVGFTSLRQEKGQGDSVRISFEITANSYEIVVREVRDIFGEFFALEEPDYTYAFVLPPERRAAEYYPDISITDLVPGNHRYLRVNTPKAYTAKLAEAINKASDEGRLPELLHKAVPDSRHSEYTGLSLVLKSGDNYLEVYQQIAALMLTVTLN